LLQNLPCHESSSEAFQSHNSLGVRDQQINLKTSTTLQPTTPLNYFEFPSNCIEPKVKSVRDEQQSIGSCQPDSARNLKAEVSSAFFAASNNLKLKQLSDIKVVL
jgi:hypothetical protein